MKFQVSLFLLKWLVHTESKPQASQAVSQVENSILLKKKSQEES